MCLRYVSGWGTGCGYPVPAKLSYRQRRRAICGFLPSNLGAARVEGVIEQGSLWLACCGWMVSPTVSVRVGRRLMGSLIDELQRREAAAREEAEELRGRIVQLAERLAGVEDWLSRLVVARETVGEVLSEAGGGGAPGGGAGGGGRPGAGGPAGGR